MSCVCHAFASVHCCLVVTCWEKADLLTFFVTFPCAILGQVWYLIVLIPDLCVLSYLHLKEIDTHGGNSWLHEALAEERP